jgi:4-hydroxy-tetrahydrodipicolinate synthase
MIAAMVTSFRDDGALDVAATRASVRHLIASGAGGLCPLGGTGEPLSMTVDEHKQVIDAVVNEAAGRVPVVVGTLLPRQEDIFECGRHAKAAGADAIMVIPPYFINTRPAHTRAHFQAIAERVDMPMVLFHSPGRSGVRLTAEGILQLLEAVPSFVAIKETSGDLAICAELVRSAPKEFRVLQGLDEYVLSSLVLGCRGAVLSLGALVPTLLRNLESAYAGGRLEEAQRLQLSLLPLCNVIYGEPNPGPLKVALAMARHPAGPTRRPIYPVSRETIASLEQLLPEVLRLEKGA